MCGLVGIAGNLSFDDEDRIKKLLWMDYFRGKDSTGLAAVSNKDGEVTMAKIASHPADLFQSSKFDAVLQGYSSIAFLGHNRAATIGAVNGYNAHPYQFGHIVGAHNGTLTLDSWTDLCELANEDFEVDSMAVFACIERAGIEKTIATMQGAWALSFIDTKKRCLYLIKNDQRPLWFGYSKEKDSVYYASESWMMRAASDASRVPEKFWISDEGYSFFPVENDVLYEFDLDELLASAGQFKPSCKPLEGRKPEVKKATGFFPKTAGSSGTTYTTSKRDVSTVEIQKGSYSFPFGEIEDIVGSEVYGEGDVLFALNKGCQWCKKPIKMGDLGLVLYPKKDMVLCHTCHSKDSVQNTVLVSPI
jgi:predicted glutamine amidotransferase